MEHMKRMQQFFKEWEDKVEYDMMKIMMDPARMKRMLEEKEGQNVR